MPQTKQKALPLPMGKSCKCSTREKTVNFKQTAYRQNTGREKRNRKENSTSKKKQICHSRRLFLTKTVTKALPTIPSESHHGKTHTDPSNKKPGVGGRMDLPQENAHGQTLNTSQPRVVFFLAVEGR